MELKRQLGVSYPTSWKIKHKLVEAMKDRDGRYLLRGIVHIDDAYFGGELNGGKAGRGSENKVPFVAALEMSDENRPNSSQAQSREWIYKRCHCGLVFG